MFASVSLTHCFPAFCFSHMGSHYHLMHVLMVGLLFSFFQKLKLIFCYFSRVPRFCKNSLLSCFAIMQKRCHLYKYRDTLGFVTSSILLNFLYPAYFLYIFNLVNKIDIGNWMNAFSKAPLHSFLGNIFSMEWMFVYLKQYLSVFMHKVLYNLFTLFIPIAYPQ